MKSKGEGEVTMSILQSNFVSKHETPAEHSDLLEDNYFSAKRYQYNSF